MSKVRRFLLAGASAGVLLLGTMQPAQAGPAIGLVGALAGVAVSAAGASTLVATIVTTAISFVGSALFGPKQPKPPKPEDRGRMIASIQSDPPHRYILGRARVAGDVVRRHRKSKPGSEKNEYFYQVQVIAADEIDAIEEWWVDNEKVEINGDGWVLSAPYGKYEEHSAKLEFAGVPIDGDTISIDGQTYTFRVTPPGAMEILIGLDPQETAQNVYDVLTAPGQPGRIDDLKFTFVRAVTGTEEAPENAGIIAKWNGAEQLSSSFPLAESSAALTWSRGDLLGEFRGKLRVFWGLGSPDQQANPYLRSEVPDKYPASARGRGRAYIGFRAEYDEGVFPAGLPDVSVVVRGHRVLDTRTGVTAWSDNAALCHAWFKTSAAGYGNTIDELDTDLVSAAANACDESVATLDGTEPRYRCNGIVDTSQDRAATNAALLGAMAGRETFSGGKWRIFAGVWEPPEHEVSDEWWTGGITWTPKRSRRSLINVVRGTFISPDHKWQPIAYPPIRDAEAAANDNGELVEVLDHPFVTSHTQAQRIAWITFRANRQQGAFAGETDWFGLRLRACSMVRVTVERFGLVQRAMVCTAWRLSMRGDGHPVVEMTFQEDAPSVYASAVADLQELPEMEAADLPASNRNNPAAPSGGSVAA